MDRDFLKKQIFESKDKGLSPLVFLSDQAREEFWAVLDSCRDTIEERAQTADPKVKNSNAHLNLQKENIELKGIVDQEKIKNAYLTAKVDELTLIRNEHFKMKYEHEILQDRYQELEDRNDEMQLKF